MFKKLIKTAPEIIHSEWKDATLSFYDIDPSDQKNWGEYSNFETKQDDLSHEAIVQSALLSLRYKIVDGDTFESQRSMMTIRTGIISSTEKLDRKYKFRDHDLSHITIEPFLKANGIGTNDNVSISGREEIMQHLMQYIYPKCHVIDILKDYETGQYPQRLSEVQNELKKYRLECKKDFESIYDNNEIYRNKIAQIIIANIIYSVYHTVIHLTYVLPLKVESRKLQNHIHLGPIYDKMIKNAKELKPYTDSYFEKNGIEQFSKAAKNWNLNLSIEHIITESQSNLIPKNIVDEVNPGYIPKVKKKNSKIRYFSNKIIEKLLS
jgi:hypothetical protein